MTANPSETSLIETWRGCANAWECDEMGHMNVRFYLTRCGEGLGRMAAALAMPGAFGPKATSTLRPLQQHIRFHAEARAGVPLSMRGGIAAIDETTAAIYQELLHADGRPAATFLTRLAHVDAYSGKSFPWSSRSRALAESLACAVPDYAAQRSVNLDAPAPHASRARAEALGAPIIGLGMIQPDMVDAFGRLRADMIIGRISDAAPNLFARWRSEAGAKQGKPLGGAVVEYRVDYRRWPGVGDLMEIRSGVIAMQDKTQRVVHWLLDPVSGDAYGTAEVIAVTFDLETRKAVAPSPEHRAALESRAIPGLAT